MSGRDRAGSGPRGSSMGGGRGGPGGSRGGGPGGGARDGFRRPGPRPVFGGSGRGDRPGSGPRGPGFGGPGGGRRVAPAPLRILHEDESIIAVEKPAGMALSVPPGRDRRPGTLTIQDQVLSHVRQGGGRRAGAWGVHELDREVSGIVVFAKSPAMAESIRSAFAAKKADAIYLGVVGGLVGASARLPTEPAGSPPDAAGEVPAGESGDAERSSTEQRPAMGTVRSFLRRIGTHVESIPTDEFSGDRASSRRAEAPRLAITHYRVVASGRGRTLLRLRVKNPRMHQARAHMRDLGYPVVGDSEYGSTETSNRVLLHLAEIAFPHPATHAALRLICPAPASFWDAIGSPPPMEASRPGSAAKPVASGRDDARGWDHVAEWYDSLVSGTRSDLQDAVVTPGVLRLLGPRRGERVLDIACGPGELVRALASMGVDALGVDAAPRMIELARDRAATDQPGERAGSARFAACDARSLVELRGMLDQPGDDVFSGGFDAATCVMALMNIDALEAVARGTAALLKDGGRFVGVVLHPAFRSPGMTSWGWTEQPAGPSGRGGMIRQQFRRVDAYLDEQAREVTMNPGAVARGEPAVVTLTHHRPIGAYVAALGDAGLLVDRIEEWASPRKSEPGPRAAEEDRARREIPMFLAIRAVKVGAHPRE